MHRTTTHRLPRLPSPNRSHPATSTMSTLGKINMEGFRFERANGLNTPHAMQIVKIYLENDRLRRAIAKLGLGMPGRLEALVSALQVCWNSASQTIRNVPAEESQEYPDDDYLFGGSESPKIFTSSQEADDAISAEEMLRAVGKMASLVVDDCESENPDGIGGERTKVSHRSINIAMFAEAISALQHHKSNAFRTALLDEALAPVQVATKYEGRPDESKEDFKLLVLREDNQRLMDELKRERDNRKIDRRTIREQKERIEELSEQLEYVQLGQGQSETTQSQRDLQQAIQKSADKAVESEINEAKKAAATAEAKAISLEEQLHGSQRRVGILLEATEEAAQQMLDAKERSRVMILEADSELNETRNELDEVRDERDEVKDERNQVKGKLGKVLGELSGMRVELNEMRDELIEVLDENGRRRKIPRNR